MQTGYSLDIKDFNKLVAHADRTIKQLQDSIRTRKLLIKQLRPHDGKQLNKRMETYGDLEGFRVYHSHRYEWHYLNVRDTGKDTNISHEISLAGYQGKKLSIAHMEKQVEESEKDLQRMLINNERITELVAVYNNALQSYEKAESELRDIPGYYTFSRW